MRPRHNKIHDFAGADHTADTLAHVNAKISDATLGDAGDYCEDKFEEAVFIPVEDFIDGYAPPGALTTLVSVAATGRDKYRDFAGGVADEDVVIPWQVPSDLVVADGIKFRVVGYLTSEVDPAALSQGVVFGLQGFSLGTGDPLGGAWGIVQLSSVDNLFTLGCVTHDYYTTSSSGEITITDLAQGERAILKLYRDQDHGEDTYGEEIGVTGIVITYTRNPVGV